MPSLKITTWPFAVLGAILSLYALYVEHKISHKSPVEEEGVEEFSALCDIESIGASCSATFSLPEGKLVSFLGIVPEGHLLDVPNAFLGFLFYVYWLVVSPKVPPMLTLVISIVGMTTSFFLAYKLYILRELCVLCLTTHVINLRLLLAAYYQLEGTSKEPELKEPPKVKRI